MTMTGIPTPVRSRDLSVAQLTGRSCCWCKADLTRTGQSRIPVGTTGAPLVPLFCCRHCHNLGRRLPLFPELGAV